MPGRNYTNSVDKYRYTFNGKESDPETGTQDYGMRIYNPNLGRFLSTDPLTKDYPWYTPYQFAGNKPIKFIDLDGAEENKPDNSNNDNQPKQKSLTDKEVQDIKNWASSLNNNQLTPAPIPVTDKNKGNISDVSFGETGNIYPTKNNIYKPEKWDAQKLKRSEERRVGKECAVRCRSRWSPYH